MTPDEHSILRKIDATMEHNSNLLAVLSTQVEAHGARLGQMDRKLDKACERGTQNSTWIKAIIGVSSALWVVLASVLAGMLGGQK